MPNLLREVMFPVRVSPQSGFVRTVSREPSSGGDSRVPSLLKEDPLNSGGGLSLSVNKVAGEIEEA
jgi:hypothetical protein